MTPVSLNVTVLSEHLDMHVAHFLEVLSFGWAGRESFLLTNT